MSRSQNVTELLLSGVNTENNSISPYYDLVSSKEAGAPSRRPK